MFRDLRGSPCRNREKLEMAEKSDLKLSLKEPYHWPGTLILLVSQKCFSQFFYKGVKKFDVLGVKNHSIHVRITFARAFV